MKEITSSLLNNFDRIAEAPDAVPRLRRFILDLAVRGKLVEQDSKDEPAVELLKRIWTIAGQRAAVSGSHKGAPPFSLPPGWSWARVGEITTKTGSGSTPRGGKSVYKSAGVPFLRSQNIYDDGLRLNDVAYIDLDTHTRMVGTALEPGDLLLNITGGSIGRCSRIPDSSIEANISQHVAIIRLAVPQMRDFMHKVVLSPFFQSFVLGKQTGAGRGGLPKNRMDQIPVPLPPLAEQHRIVAKVDELMALCYRLEAAQNKREQRRDRLAAASLNRINQPAPSAEGEAATTFREHARFHLAHLPRLTTRPEHIKSLRQSILNLAVVGRLVEQDPTDEPASELLERIQAEKSRLVKAGKISRRSQAKTTKLANSEFVIPDNWFRAKVADVVNELQTGPFGSSLHQSDYQIGGTPVINPASIQYECIVPVRKMAVGEETLRRLASFKLRRGDIVMARRGEMGRCAVVNEVEAGWLCGTGSLVLRPSRLVYDRFLVLLIGSPIGREYLGGTAVGSTMQNLNQSILLNLPFGLPPQAEQHRIVAKVDELMAVCDQLEAQLTATQTDSRRLLEAVLREALAPAMEEAA